MAELNDEKKWSIIDNILKRAEKVAYTLEIAANKGVWLSQFSPRLDESLSALRLFQLKELFNMNDKSFADTIANMLPIGEMPKTPLTSAEADRIAREYAKSIWNAKEIAITSNVVSKVTVEDKEIEANKVHGLAEFPYMHTSHSGVYSGGSVRCDFTLWIDFNGKVVKAKNKLEKAVKNEPPPVDYSTSELASFTTIGPTIIEPNSVSDMLDRITKEKMDKSLGETEKRLRKKFGL
jgi:hypothetical protein